MLLEHYTQVLDAVKAGHERVLVTVTESSDAAIEGCKACFSRDGNAVGAIPDTPFLKEADIIELCRDVLITNKPRLQLFGCRKGSYAELFFQPVLPAPELIILGGGHVALPLAAMADLAGFRVVVVDDRPEFANKNRFPMATVICDDFTEVFRKTNIHPNSYLTIITRGHQYDALCLQEALQTNACYIGMIGSKKKVKDVLEKISQKGFTQDLLQSVYAPIGIPIGAETPSEIAVSILAEIIAVKRGLLAKRRVMHNGS